MNQNTWKLSNEASTNRYNTSAPLGSNAFYISQGKLKSPPKPLGNVKEVKSYGPFINTGGGDVPKGNNTYIYIYKSIEPTNKEGWGE